MKIIRALRVILAPVSLLYLLGFYVKRLCARPWSSPVPVVCIGNITTGGTGKTPVVIRTASALRENGFRPGVVSRGYRGRLSAAGVCTPAVNPAPVVIGEEKCSLNRRDVPG